MLVLLGQATPVMIRKSRAGHVVETAAQRGWDKLKNGELLAVAEAAGFQVFITPDKNIRDQQNLAERSMAIIVLGNAQWPALRHHVQLVVSAVNLAVPGSYHVVEIPKK